MDTIKKAGLYLLGALVLAVCVTVIVIRSVVGGEADIKIVEHVPTSSAATEPEEEEEEIFDGEAPPFEISISSDKAKVGVGGQAIFSASLIPAQPKVKVCWYSEDTSVVKVTTDGVATGVSEGGAYLSVVCISTDTNDPKYNLPSKKYFVNVVSGADADSSQVLADRPPAGNRELLIANTQSPLSSSYAPKVVEVPDNISKTLICYMTPETLKAYTDMYNAMHKANVGDVYIISAYRSYKKQSELFEERIAVFTEQGYSQKDAEDAAKATVNPPGCSEHQLGLTVDVSTDGTTQHDFNGLAQGKWLAENCYKYGFILRYPANKVSITGIDFEPWHFRYVGVEHAAYMYTHDLCLEEYVLL